jgi:hypothetical protein
MSKSDAEARHSYRSTRRNIRFGCKPHGNGNTKPAERRAFWHAWVDAMKADQAA